MPSPTELIKFKSLRSKILVFAALPVIGTLAAISTVFVAKQYRELKESALHSIKLETARAAEQIEKANLESVTIPKVMAVAQQSGLFGNRAASVEYARQILSLHPHLTGAYFGYEPNADAQDAEAKASVSTENPKPEIDEAGRFLPYWFRDHENPSLIRLKPLVDMETSFYYQGVKNRMARRPETDGVELASQLSRHYMSNDQAISPGAQAKTMITEPYVYEGKLIFEQTYPIMINDQFVGIAGVDRALTDIRDYLASLKPFKTADFILISRRGRVIAATMDASLNSKRIEDVRFGDTILPFYEMTEEAEMALAEDPVDNREYYYDAARIPTGKWTLVMRVSSDEIQASWERQITYMISISILGLLATISILIWLANRISAKIAIAVEAAKRIADGDLTTRIEVTGTDETGRLLESIKLMTANLNALIGQVKQSSIQLTSTATKISANAKTQETAVNEFGSSTTQIAAAVKEISATSQELSKTMNNVTSNATETAELADSGRVGLEEMQAAMTTLSQANHSISSKLSVISERAKNINRVVTTISKVADQTNLLSLNAAIEAEKAGEYGLGFSVVAREVRRLADQTAVATLDIDQMVKEMQSSVSAGVMEMDKFTDHMTQGTEIVQRISSQLGAIIEHVQELTEQFESVRQGMSTQTDGAQQINSAMVQLTDAARATSTSIGAFNQATGDLRDAVGGLREEVTKFKVEQN